MSEGILIAAFLLIAGALSAIAKLLWDHVQHCKEVHSKLAEIGADVKRIQVDVGTHETGLRGATHELSNRVTEISMRLSLVERHREDGR